MRLRVGNFCFLISRPPSAIMDLSVSNSTVIIALNNSVMRLNLMNKDEIDSEMI